MGERLDGKEVELRGETWGSWDSVARTLFDRSEAMRTRAEVEGFCDAMTGMAQLARYIADGPLNDTVRGYTSMHDLCICQSGWPPEFVPILKLSPLRSGLIEFRYIDTMIVERQWHRTEPPERAIARFDHFVAQLHWVITERATAD
jgi:hypothetical protein